MKKIFLFAAAFMVATSAFSQSFQHSIGIGVFSDKIKDAEYRSSLALSYNPRMIFIETSRMSVSIGIPLSVGVSGRYKVSNDVDSNYISHNTFGYMINAPLMLSANFGAGSSKKCEKPFGWFISGGYGYYRTNKTTLGTRYYGYEGAGIRQGSSTMGAAANIGIRLGTGQHYKQNVELRFSYYRGTSNYRNDVYGLTTAYNF